MTFDPIDETAIGTKLVTTVIDRTLSVLEKKVRRVWAENKNYDVTAYVKYLRRASAHCRNMKNILFQDAAEDIEKIYVPRKLAMGRDHFDMKQYLLHLHTARTDTKERTFPATFLLGPAGAGKSCTLRMMFLQHQRQNVGRIPIFFELRSLNRIKPGNVIDIIADSINKFDGNVSVEQFEIGLEHGMFSLYLDGYDEIKHMFVEHYERELVDLSERYQDCPLVISGRPVDSPRSWRLFNVTELEKLNKNDCFEVVKKLPFKPAEKKRFITLIESRLWKSHRTFLEIPLLLVIMLLTLRNTGEISNKRHEFYEDAFLALWSKHDAMGKEGWVRSRYTKLERSDFMNYLSVFSFLSYAAEVFSFSESDVESFCDDANDLVDKDVDPEKFLKDLRISLSIFLDDGTEYKFVHRSFQEYFAARYLSMLAVANKKSVIDSLAERFDTDSVLYLMHSINRQAFEEAWVSPTIDVIQKSTPVSGMTAEKYASVCLNRRLHIIRKIYGFSIGTAQLRAFLDATRQLAKEEGRQLGVYLGKDSLLARDQGEMAGFITSLKKRQARTLSLASLVRSRE